MCWFESSPGHKGPSTKVEGFLHFRNDANSFAKVDEMQKPERRRRGGLCASPSQEYKDHRRAEPGGNPFLGTI